MKIVTASFLTLVAIAAALAGCAHDDTADAPATSTTASEDLTAASNWQALGSRQVDGHLDTDTIVVGGDEGAFTAIKVKVQGSALVMHDIKIVFGDGQVFSPNVSWFFDANTATRSIGGSEVTRVLSRKCMMF